MISKKIRVLVVDDSVIVRKMATDALNSDPGIEVVGTAIDPYAARDKIVELKPDVLTLDLEMPRMDGLTFLALLMERHPMPVVVMSSLTQRGSDCAMEALRLGAVDIVGKPAGPYSFGALSADLIEKVKIAALARPRAQKATPATISVPAPGAARAPVSVPHPAAVHSRPPIESRPIPHDPRAIILLGASTGGTEALKDVLTRLPGNLPPIAIVQHIPAMFSKTFSDRLNQLCSFEVREAVDGDRLEPGLCLVAPGNFHLGIQWCAGHYEARVVNGPPIWHQRPAVDLLFKSAADCGAAPHALAGILTGMGKDGAAGLKRLRELGANTFAQDEASSVVYGMPKAAWECGAAKVQVPLAQIADFIVRNLGHREPVVRSHAVLQ